MGSVLKKAVFFDRDGTLIEGVEYLADPAKVVPHPAALEWVRMAKSQGFLAIVVTNQSGVARGLYGTEAVERVNDRVREVFAEAGATLDDFFYCPHHPEFPAPEGTPCDCRKPAPGMILKACKAWDVDPKASAMVGDSAADLEAGRRAGLQAVFHASRDGEALTAWMGGEKREPRRISLFERKSLVPVEAFPRIPEPEARKAFRFLEYLPDLQAAKDLKRLVGRIRDAKARGKF
ncbi:MAG: D-glycero-alpha-D-manno-heptose-1,7-bisphosphate 7-phosphatase, partial [Planctomycetota bacterium]